MSNWIAGGPIRLANATGLVMVALVAGGGNPAVNVEAHTPAWGGNRMAVSLTLRSRVFVSGHDVIFGLINNVVADDRGNIFLGDSQAQEILVLDPSGMQSTTIGGPGEGPGEFKSLEGLAWSGPFLVALDWRRGITLLTPQGEAVATTSWPGRAGSRLFSGAHEALGMALVYPTITRLAPDSRPRVQYSLISQNGTVSTLPALSDSIIWPMEVDCVTQDGWIHPLRIPFSDWGPLHALLPTGLMAVGQREVYQIDLIDIESGKVERSILRNAPRILLGDDRWERQPSVEEFRGYGRQGIRMRDARDPDESCPLDRMRPQFLPVLRAIISDEEGRLWVEGTTEDGFGLAVFDLDGNLLGETRMPDRDPRVAPYVRNSLLYVVTIDEYDVQSVEVYEAAFTGGGF